MDRSTKKTLEEKIKFCLTVWDRRDAGSFFLKHVSSIQPRMHVCPCSWALRICKKICIQVYFGPVCLWLWYIDPRLRKFRIEPEASSFSWIMVTVDSLGKSGNFDSKFTRVLRNSPVTIVCILPYYLKTIPSVISSFSILKTCGFQGVYTAQILRTRYRRLIIFWA